MVETRTEKDSRRITKKQISFDLDTKVAKAILGKSNYIKAYLDIRKFMEKEGWKHIEGSVYMSKSPISNIMVLNMLKKLKKEHPYLTKCFREIHQADVSKVHSLSKQFEYDGTPGRFAKQELTQKMKPKHRSR